MLGQFKNRKKETGTSWKMVIVTEGAADASVGCETKRGSI